jgi:hypothetical protein
VAAIGLDPFLDFGVAVFDETNAFIVLAILVGDLFVDETDFFGEVLDAVDPVVENQTGIGRIGLRHLLDEVDGQVVSRHAG